MLTCYNSVSSQNVLGLRLIEYNPTRRVSRNSIRDRARSRGSSSRSSRNCSNCGTIAFIGPIEFLSKDFYVRQNVRYCRCRDCNNNRTFGFYCDRLMKLSRCFFLQSTISDGCDACLAPFRAFQRRLVDLEHRTKTRNISSSPNRSRQILIIIK